METVKAEAVVNYEVACPYCEEMIYSECQDDWDIGENFECAVIIKCPECQKFFNVDI